MKRILALALSLLLLLTALTGCQSADTGPSDTLTFITSGQASENFDPILGLAVDFTVAHALYSTLVDYGPEGEIIPNLADEWEEADDDMSVTFHLRDDVTFHDGTPLTADDVIYSLETIVNSPLFMWVGTDTVAGFEKVDDYTVRIDKVAPYVKLFETLAEYGFILPKEYHSQDPDAFDQAPIGSGPYKLVSKEADNSVILEAYDGYFGDEPGFKNVVVKAPLEPANVVIALETGEADFAPELPATQAALVEANQDLTIVRPDIAWRSNMILLEGDLLSNDENLRKAIFHGINLENAVTLGNEGVGEPATELFADFIVGDYAGTIENYVGYDEALAREYLEKSNYNGEEITLTISSNPALAESILSDLGKLGINIAINQLDSNDYYAKMYDGSLQMVLTFLGSNVDSLISLLDYFTSTNEFYGQFMVCDEEFDQLLAAAKAEPDEAAREELTRQAYQRLYDLACVVPLYDVTSNYSYGPDVTYDYPISAVAMFYYLDKIMPAAAE